MNTTRSNQEIIGELKKAIISDQALLAGLIAIGKGNSQNANFARLRIEQAKVNIARLGGR